MIGIKMRGGKKYPELEFLYSIAEDFAAL